MRKNVILLGLLLFAACSSDDDEPTTQQPTQQPAQEKTYPLTISVSENPMVYDGDDGTTRAAIITKTTFAKFYLDYTYDEFVSSSPYEVTPNGTTGTWVTSTSNSWPITETEDLGKEVTWYASSYIETGKSVFNKDGNGPYLSFVVEELATDQKDLLVAKNADNYNHCKGHLHFTFDHVTTALHFYVKKATNLDGYTLDISDIKLCNVVKSGNYYFNSSQWVPSNTRTQYSLFKAENEVPHIILGSNEYIGLNGTAVSDTDPYLFLIPQTLTKWDHTTAIASATNQSYIMIECTITENIDTDPKSYSGFAYIPFGANLMTGYLHDVYINIGLSSLYKDANQLVSNNWQQ